MTIPSLARRPLSATNVWPNRVSQLIMNETASFNFCIKKLYTSTMTTKRTEAPTSLPIDQPDVFRKQTGKKTNYTARATHARRCLVEVHRRTPEIEEAALDADGKGVRRSRARDEVRLT